MRKTFIRLFVLVFVTAFIFGFSARINADSGLMEIFCYECLYSTWETFVVVKTCCSITDPETGDIYEKCLLKTVPKKHNGWQLLFPCAELN